MTIPILTLLALLMISISSALIGSFAVMRRMTLAADAMSHIALPGLAIALLIKLDPFIGGLAALILGALLIWGLERKTKIATETVIGVVFSASLAIGSLLIETDHELLEALFGNVESITRLDGWIGLVVGLLLIGFVLKLKEKFVLTTLAPDIAKTTGLNNPKLNLVFLLVFALNIILGLKFLGVLLMGSLIIIPAATAKNLAKNFKSDLGISSIVAVLSTGLGILISQFNNLELGPVIVSVAAAIFFISLFFVKE